jgi:hypothetical protein
MLIVIDLCENEGREVGKMGKCLPGGWVIIYPEKEGHFIRHKEVSSGFQ